MTTTTLDERAPAPEPAPVTAPPELSSRQIGVVFATIVLGILLSALDQTIVATALPTIVGDLGGAGHVAWVVTSYILTSTIATVLAGKLGDLLGRKWVFQASVVIFLVGSGLSGAAGGMTTLIAWRAVQGIGAGGLIVTATALIGDLIPLRERGKYQGALGAVFGVTTVIGPLLGGLFTDHLSWRWVFYVNLPVGLVVLVMSARTIPAMRTTVRPVIDYVGIVFVAIGAGGLVLATSLGGNSYAWSSPQIIGIYVAAVIGIAIFIAVESRTREPMLPLRLFRSPVFSVVMVLALVVGFAMLGAITFLPTYLQYVKAVSATDSGLRTLPMVGGLLVTSIAAGNIVSRTGRYKVFPVAGSLIMAVGLWLMSLLDVDTGFWRISLSMIVLGAGIGLSMQVLTIIVQNTSRYEDLGVATSAVTFFRTLGSSFGTAVFGAVYSNAIASRLGPALAASPGVDPKAVSAPSALHANPESKIMPIVAAYADSLQVVFRYAVPVAAVAFVVSLFLREVPLRGLSRSTATDMGEGFGIPDPLDCNGRLEVAVGRLLRKSSKAELPAIRANSGTALNPADGWCVGQIRVRRHLGLPHGLDDVAHRLRIPPDVLRPAFENAVAHGYLSGRMDDLQTTELGRVESDKIILALTDWLQAKLDVPDDDVRAALTGGDGADGPDGPALPAETSAGLPAQHDGWTSDREALYQALDNLARSVLSDEALMPTAELAAR